MSTKIRGMICFCFETMLIVGITLFAVLPMSCKITESGIHVLNGDYVCPKIQKFYLEDSKTLKLDFSEPVKLKSYNVFSDSETSLKAKELICENEKEIAIRLDEEMIIGKNYELYGVVKDEYGNSLTFEIPFLGFNGNVPKLMITEIQTTTVSSRTKFETENDFYKNEFLEFVALTDGNLSGIELVSAYDGYERTFVMPALEVHKGEVVVIHMRKKGNGCVNEIGEDLNLATAPYSRDGVRDFWIDDERTAIGNKTDILILWNSDNHVVLDAVMYCESKYSEWPAKEQEYLKYIEDAGIFESIEVTSAINGDSLGSTKTLQRINANEILKKFLIDENCEYPVKNDKLFWSIDVNSAGVL